MSAATLIRLAFAFNVLVLLPVVWSLYTHSGAGRLAAFSGKVDNVDGLRLMLAALWTGVALCSAAGLAAPMTFAPLLAFQVVYKGIWLVTAAWPTLRNEGMGELPSGIAAIFLLIVLVWPFILYAWWRESLIQT